MPSGRSVVLRMTRTGLPKAGASLLDAAAVCKDQVAGRHEIVEVQHIQGFNKADAVAAGQLLRGDPTHLGDSYGWDK